MKSCKSCELIRKRNADLLRERNEARAIAHARGLDAGELEAQNRRLLDELQRARAQLKLGAFHRVEVILERALEPKP